jgi:hypothetical protein
MSRHGAQDDGAASGFANASSGGYQARRKPLGEDGKRTAKPCGLDTRGWCQVVGGASGPTGPAGRQAGSDGGKTNSSPERARHKPSTHCAGNAGLLRLYLYARVRFPLRTIAHETVGAASTRHSLRPLSRWGERTSKARAPSASRERGGVFNERRVVFMGPPSLRGAERRSNPCFRVRRNRIASRKPVIERIFARPVGSQGRSRRPGRLTPQHA